MLSEVERVWLACAIDTEGSIRLHVNKSRGYSRPEIAVYNTNREWIERVATLIKRETGSGYIQKRVPRRNSFNVKDQFSFTIGGRKAQMVLSQLLGFFIIKRDKAEALVKFPILTREDIKVRHDVANGRFLPGRLKYANSELTLKINAQEPLENAGGCPTIAGSGNTTNHPTKAELLAEAKRLCEKFGFGFTLEDLSYKELRKIVSIWKD